MGSSPTIGTIKNYPPDKSELISVRVFRQGNFTTWDRVTQPVFAEVSGIILIKRYFMDLNKMLLENRISLLRSRDPVGNAKIIRKLERRLRKMVG